MPKLQAGLPKDPDQNGLISIARDLIADPLKKRVVLAVVDCSKITQDTTTGAMETTVRVRRIEQVHPDDITEAERLVRRALEYRMGRAVLNIDLERDIEEWFGNGFELDPTTGELRARTDQGDNDADQH